jgi:hypothetical protein
MINDRLQKKKKQPKFIHEESFQKNDYTKQVSFDNLFMKICRTGKLEPTFFKLKEVSCRFLHHGDPYLKMGPFKEEQTSELPYVVVFHDIFSDNEIDELIQEATPHLTRKRHNNNDRSVKK